MKWTAWWTAAWLAAAGVVLAGAAGSCGQGTPEDYCAAWVEKACKVIGGCCAPHTVFDPEGCRAAESSRCLTATQADQVHAGTYRFDESTADACLGAPASCADLDPPSPPTVTRRQACNRMLSGYRAPGEACLGDADCQDVGDFGLCYDGTLAGQPAGQSVCAQVVIDKSHCSFSIDDATLHLCPDDKYCDLAHRTPAASGSPTKLAFDFSAPCAARIAEGGSCIDPNSDSGLLPCRAGFFCNVTGGATATCVAQRHENDSCEFNTAEGVCVAGLACQTPLAGGPPICQKVAPDSVSCPIPLHCGDGMCAFGESPSTCPEDCGMPAVCGDGMCTPPESTVTCPVDCAGDICGDGVCGPTENMETCPTDCGGDICGDGFCGPNENPATCPPDCNGHQCRQCACELTQAQGGCADLCDENLNGSTTPDFCDDASAQPACFMCILASCGEEPGACN